MSKRGWLIWAAWFSILAIIVVTLLPIGLRPATGFSPNIERFVVMAIVGALFVMAYPSRFWLIVVSLACVSALIEPLQFFAAGRHPSFKDVVVKLSGGLAGAIVGGFASRALASSKDGFR